MLGERESLERVAALGFDGALIDVDHDLPRLLADASPDFTAVATTPDTPALLVYTSGTTGAPKGALHGHRVLAGHLPGFELSHDFFPQPGDRIWTPADWAWIGGLYDVVMPALAHGMPVVAFRTPRFDPEQAFDLIARRGDPQRLHARHGAADDAAQRRRAGVAAHDRERRRDGRRGDGGLVPGALRRAPERVLRPDRGEPADRELRRLAGAARLDGSRLSRARAAARGRRDRGARRGRPGRLPRLLARRGGHRRQGAGRLAAHRRPGRGRRRGQLPERRARRRPDLERRPSHRAGRDRGVPDPAPVRVDRRGDRRARTPSAARW